MHTDRISSYDIYITFAVLDLEHKACTLDGRMETVVVHSEAFRR